MKDDKQIQPKTSESMFFSDIAKILSDGRKKTHALFLKRKKSSDLVKSLYSIP
jgi:hypothetical protein